MTRTQARRPALPPVTVYKLQQAAEMLERMAREKTAVFAQSAADYASEHRVRSERPLSAVEVAQVAAGLSDVFQGHDPIDVAERVRASSLRATDEPPRAEVLLAAGVSTAPAFLDIVLRLVALVEMSDDALEAAVETGGFEAAIDESCRDLKRLELGVARKRSAAALQHVAVAAGESAGEMWGLVVRTISAALKDAVRPHSTLSSLTGSLEPTGGDAATSSIAPNGGTP